MLPKIALDRITVHLAGRPVLTEVTWSLEHGRHWAVVGANGSGKSTFLRVLAGTQWIDYDGGKRTYSSDGFQPESTVRAAAWIRHVSAEQHERYARLDLPLTGEAVIGSGFDNSLYVHRTLGAAESARVDTLIAGLDLGAFVHRPLRELSTGQLRRILIARAIAREPQVLLLDEFTNGLDASARRDVLELLDRIADTVTLVVASHRSADFPAAITHTASLRGGRLARADESRPAPQRPPDRSARASGGPASTASDVLVDIRDADVYRGETLVLRQVTWRLRRGEHTAVRGANGAGKTTFAGLVAGTISAATGAHVVRFGEIGPFDIWKLKERIAHVSDDLQIAYDQRETVEAVVASGFPSSIGLFVEPTPGQWDIVGTLLGRVGLDALRGRAFTQLSFGERRKVLIARSFVRRPDVLVLDEIWNGLDAAFRLALRALLAEMTAAGTTLVAIAHEADDDIVALTRRTCTIEGGRIYESIPDPDSSLTFERS